uniref:LON peptidase substrate-binding domain-containing protein n=1 Tax=Thaumasiovibrio occultus TaxID=1891184 RepID=UPI00131C3CBD|nr:LON peptidase substrate-binding domain-containing protein [Thaumasiovibrio occultus]
MTKLHLFPLRSVVLPGGRLKLRIFEPRYQRLLTEALQQQQGFGITLIEQGSATQPTSLMSLGTLVSIVDFNHDSNGVLTVVVEGQQRFEIVEYWQNDDGLHSGNVVWLTNWHSVPQPTDPTSHYELLPLKLKQVNQQFPKLLELHNHCIFEDMIWVCQRWLELMPLDAANFVKLASSSDCLPALNFLLASLQSSEALQQTQH